MLTYPMFFYLVPEQKEYREKNLIRFNIHKTKSRPSSQKRAEFFRFSTHKTVMKKIWQNAMHKNPFHNNYFLYIPVLRLRFQPLQFCLLPAKKNQNPF